MKILIMKFRTNDLAPSIGKQIEFSGKIVHDFFGFTKNDETINFVYNDYNFKPSLNGTVILGNLSLSPSRDDYKVYQNPDKSLFLKNFFIQELGLSLEENKDDYFTLTKLSDKDYSLSYIPHDSDLGKLIVGQHLKTGDVVDVVEDEIKSKETSELDSFSRQKIFFGAPGTGKSFTLNELAKKFENQEKFDVAEAIRRDFSRINSEENFVPQCLAIGTKYASEILEKYPKNTQKEINDVLGKDKEDDIAGYYVKTGAQAKAFLSYGDFSHDIDKFVERVTFHPNYTYAQFVGSYKPVAKKIDITKGFSADKKDILNVLKDQSKTGQEKYDLLYEKFRDENSLTRLPLLIGLYSDDEFQTKKIDGSAASNDNSVERNHGRAIRPFVSLFDDKSRDDEITYEYVPGPFMRTYVTAKKDPHQKYLLVIEEINRANVAAVFGDVFQLLDRKNGVSEYPVTASEDVRNFLADNGINEKELCIPDNMYIWATMNSADQGVFPMDTAFKRRWKFEYIGIDDNEGGVDAYEIPLQKKDDGSHEWISWNQIRHSINDKLTDMKINEDKLLGPYFISEEDLMTVRDRNETNADEFVKLFKSKVLMYLFEDAAKMKQKSLFKEKIDVDGKTIDVKMRFSSICDAFDKVGQGIFNFD